MSSPAISALAVLCGTGQAAVDGNLISLLMGHGGKGNEKGRREEDD